MKRLLSALFLVILCIGALCALSSCDKEHTPSVAVRENEVAATCERAGSYDQVVYCSECGEEMSRTKKIIEKLPHTEVIVEAVAPTCTASGLTTGLKCSSCGEILVAQTEVPALGHKSAEAVKENEVFASCAVDGNYDIVVYCSVCDAELSRKLIVVSATGEHVYATETERVDSSCETVGYCVEACGCGETNRFEIPAKGHDMVTDAAVDPTCTETGLTEGSHCSRCDYKIAQETVSALGHTEVINAAVDPTCTKIGLTEGSHCSVCDTILIAQQTIAVIPHSFDCEVVENRYIKSPATATESAVYFKSCSCGEKGNLAFEYGDPLGYTITFDLNGGTSSKELKTIQSLSISKDDLDFDVIKANWIFRGWSLNGVKIFDENGVQLNSITYSDNMTFKAEFNQKIILKIQKILNNAPVNFDMATLTGAGEYNYNTSVNLSTRPETGYKFEGWYYNNILLSTNVDYNYKMWSDDITLQARYSYDEYTLTVFSNKEELGIVNINNGIYINNGMYANNQTYRADYTESITIAAFTHTKKRFLGWFNENNELVSTNAVYSFVMPNRDYTLEAKWNEFDIKYNLDGGKNNSDNPTKFAVEDNIALLSPTKDDYIFDGWYTDAAFTQEGKIDSIQSGTNYDIELFAKWKACKYTITYDETKEIYGSVTITFDNNYDGAHEATTRKLSKGDVLVVPPNPEREGYLFSGWYINPECTTEYTFENDIKQDLTLYAGWANCEFVNDDTYPWKVSEDEITSTNKANNSTSTYQIVANSDVKISFNYISSSENDYDVLTVLINGDAISSNEWDGEISLSKGDVLTFAYTKDFKDISNTDCAHIKNIKIVSNYTQTNYPKVDIQHVIGYEFEKRQECSVVVSYGESHVLPTLTLPGCTFLGWFNGETRIESGIWNIDEDVTLVPKFVADIYTITLDAANGECSASEIKGSYEEEHKLPIPTRAGYDFLGWYDEDDEKIEGDSYTFGTTNVTLVAKWDAHTYTITYDETKRTETTVYAMVTFDYNYEGAPDAIERQLKKGDTVVAPANPTREGYIFVGWYTNAECISAYEFANDVTSDLTLYAKWVNCEQDNAGVFVNDINHPWSIDGDIIKSTNKAHNSTSTFKIIAPWDANISFEYKISAESDYDTLNILKNGELLFNLEGIENYRNSGSISVKKDDIITFVYSKDYKDSAGEDCAYIRNIRFTSTYVQPNIPIVDVQNEIEYDYMKRHECSIEVTMGVLHVLPTYMQDGYTFLGWFDADGNCVPSGPWSIPNANGMVLTPKWQVNTYTVTLDPDGGELDNETVSVTYNEPYTLPDPTKVGYTFNGWFLNNDEEYAGGIWSIATDLTLVAKWTANEYTVTYENADYYVTVTFDYNYSGSASSTVTLTNGQTLSRPTAPVRSGYVFTGWYTNSSCTTRYEFTGTITGDMTLYAGWKEMSLTSMYTETQINPADYTSSSDYYSVSTSSTSSSYKKHIYLVAEESGTHYIYWKNSQSSSYYGYYLQIYNLTAGTTIRSSSNTYSTSYQSSSFTCSKGDVIVISLYRCNTSYSSYAYFYFSGFSSPAASTANASILFEYKNDSTYIDSVEYGANYTLPVPVRTGYTFGGWYNGDTKVENGAWNIASDVTLTAEWTANTYTVNFNANGGSVSPASITATYDSSFMLPTPTRTGYTFSGWYNGSTKVTSGIWIEASDITLVAKWTVNSYTVTYQDVEKNDTDITVTLDYNYNGSTPYTVVLTNGQILSYPTVPTRSSYAFAGWYTTSSCTTAYDFSDTITDDITLYAKWVSMVSSYYSREYLDIASYNSSSSKKTISTNSSSSSSQNYYYFTCYKSGTYTLYAAHYTGDFYITGYNVTSGTTILSKANLWSSNPSTSVTFTANAGDVIYLSLYKYSSSGSTGQCTIYMSGAGYPTSTATAATNKFEYKNDSTYIDSVEYGANYTLPVPVRTGYTFLGWYNGDEKFDSATWNIAADVTLTAKWEKDDSGSV